MNPTIMEYLARERIAGMMIEADQSRRRSVDWSDETTPHYATPSWWTMLARLRVQLVGRRFRIKIKPVSSCILQSQVKLDC